MLIELKVNNFMDRERVVNALVNAGYKVSVEERKLGIIKDGIPCKDFIVKIEESK